MKWLRGIWKIETQQDYLFCLGRYLLGRRPVAQVREIPGDAREYLSAEPGGGRAGGKAWRISGDGRTYGEKDSVRGDGKIYGEKDSIRGGGRSYGERNSVRGDGKIYGQRYSDRGNREIYGQMGNAPGSGGEAAGGESSGRG